MPIFGGDITEEAFNGWLSIWRSNYEKGLWNADLLDPWESQMPQALKGVDAKVIVSSGGVAGGIVSEGMGYGLMLEGMLAAKTGDKTSMANAKSFMKAWLGMVHGPDGFQQPLAGGGDQKDAATRTDTSPYGISAVEWSHEGTAAVGVPAWKFPIDKDTLLANQGSASDGDQDAITGMVYLTSALGSPADMVDMTIRAVISFSSADLGFPDMYRILPDGSKAFVPKMGSMWGGLTPEEGKFATNQHPWCYGPGYFAPAAYRTFRDFARSHWREEFNDYLPQRLDGTYIGLEDLLLAFDSAVNTGYNILYYSSCESGSVSNWVGVKAACADEENLSCAGVPWEHTPYVGEEKGECSTSGTTWGSFGADASRTAWRIAMDYVLFREETQLTTIYDRKGVRRDDVVFDAQTYLNRLAEQYQTNSHCDGGIPGDCMNFTQDPKRSPWRLAYSFVTDKKFHAPGLTCDYVPNPPESWWAGFMSYPTFTAFVAPHGSTESQKMTNWMDTFASMCSWENVNMWHYKEGNEKPKGAICQDTYFEASQAVISMFIMSDKLSNLPGMDTGPLIFKSEMLAVDGIDGTSSSLGVRFSGLLPWITAAMFTGFAAMAVSRARRERIKYSHVHGEQAGSPLRDVVDEESLNI